MELSNVQRSVVERVVNAFETGSADGNYGAISIFADGPHDMRQITYGRSQTTEYGHLRELVRRYVEAGGQFSAAMAVFADDINRVPLTDNAQFKQLLRDAGRKDPVMRRVQDDFFTDKYFKPAMVWADKHGFTQPLSALVIYDSFIHSGGILDLLRSRFHESPPAAGGNEKKWIRAYVKARHDWLASHSRKILQKTVYRTVCFQCEIDRDNWDLCKAPVDANGVPVSALTA